MAVLTAIEDHARLKKANRAIVEALAGSYGWNLPAEIVEVTEAEVDKSTAHWGIKKGNASWQTKKT